MISDTTDRVNQSCTSLMTIIKGLHSTRSVYVIKCQPTNVCHPGQGMAQSQLALRLLFWFKE